MRIVFFGMTGQFSVPPLRALLNAGVTVRAVVISASRGSNGPFPQQLKPPPLAPSDLPIVDPCLNSTIIHLAWKHQIPVWKVGALSNPKTVALLHTLQADVITVACFSRIFPPGLLRLPRFGCLNLHPSLLPAYRGPEPLFWIARHDERETGVTLHFLDEGVDSGNIVAQTRFSRPDGMSGAALERQCAREGGTLLLEAVQALEQGNKLAGTPQNKQHASYFSAPSAEHFVVPSQWPARRAFNFLRGAEQWPLSVDVGDTRFNIRVAKSYSDEHTLDRPFILLADEVWVQFQPGVLRSGIYR